MDEYAAKAIVLRAMEQIEREGEDSGSAWELQTDLWHALRRQRRQRGRRRVKQSDGRVRTLQVTTADAGVHVFHAEAAGWRRTTFPDGWAADHLWRDSRFTSLWVMTFTRAGARMRSHWKR